MSIDRAALQIYERFRGEVDGWTRCRGGGADPVGDGTWALIDEFVMALRAADSGHASAAFRSRLEERIRDAVPDPTAAAELRRIAQASVRW